MEPGKEPHVMPVIICDGRGSSPKCLQIAKNCNFVRFWQYILFHVCACVSVRACLCGSLLLKWHTSQYLLISIEHEFNTS